MIIIIVFFIAGFLISFLFLKQDFRYGDGILDWHLIPISLFACVLGAILSGIIGFLISLSLPADTIIESEYKNLVSLQDANSVSGSFFLGCGSVNSKMKYTYYYESSNGMFRMGQVSYKYASITYDSIPRMETKETKYTDSWVNWFAIDFECRNDKYIFHVPKGTIKNDYNLDAN